jgi:hypothetical protein
MVERNASTQGKAAVKSMLDPKLGYIRDRPAVVSTETYARKVPLFLLAFLFVSNLLPTASGWRLGNVPAQDKRQHAHVPSENDQRRLSSADPLRKFIGDAIMSLPDHVESQETWLGTLNIMLTNFRCFDASFGEITMDLVEGETGGETFRLEITDAVFQCSMNVTWNYGKNGNQNGAGNASLISNKNFLTASVSTDNSTANDTSCEGTLIDIDTLEFDGDLSFQVMNLYRCVPV